MKSPPCGESKVQRTIIFFEERKRYPSLFAEKGKANPRLKESERG